MKKVLLAIVLLLAFSSISNAKCSCVCVNNQKQFVCANSWDIPIGWCGGPCY